MEKEYKWYVKIVYANGRVEKGVITSEFNKSGDLIASLFGDGFKPFTMNTLRGRGQGVINTGRVQSVYIYANKHFKD